MREAEARKLPSACGSQRGSGFWPKDTVVRWKA